MTSRYSMNGIKLFVLLTALLCTPITTWATDYNVDNETDLRNAITGGNSYALNCNYCYTADEPHSFGSFGECSVCHLISLSDDADNSATIAQWNNTEKSVTLTGRTLYRDGSWNTLCLPFTIDETMNKVETDYVDFVGSYNPVDIPGEDRTMLFLGANNTLYYPNDIMTINSFRAYFLLKGIVVGDPIAGVRAFTMNFGDENTTGMEKTQSSMSNIQHHEAWYDLRGRKLHGKPTTKGVYINNGSKVMIKY